MQKVIGTDWIHEYKAIRTIDDPTNAAELYNFIQFCIWMSTSTLELHKRMQSLDSILEPAYPQAAEKKRRALKDIPLYKLSRGTEHKISIDSRQDSLRNVAKIAFSKRCSIVCTYTDANAACWADIVTNTRK